MARLDVRRSEALARPLRVEKFVVEARDVLDAEFARREELAAGYNASVAQSESPGRTGSQDDATTAVSNAPQPGLLQTLRVAPLVGNGARGVALGLAF